MTDGIGRGVVVRGSNNGRNTVTKWPDRGGLLGLCEPFDKGLRDGSRNARATNLLLIHS
jgi:hypothetical protein